MSPSVLLAVICVLPLRTSLASRDPILEPVLEWSRLTFRGQGEDVGVGGVDTLLGSVRAFGDRLFVSAPRWRSSSANATLAVVRWGEASRTGSRPGSPPLTPFPSVDENDFRKGPLFSFVC